MIETIKLIRKIFKQIRKYNTIIIHGHIRPDGDCYGAQFGLQRTIKARFPHKEVYVVGQTSDFVSFVGKPDVIEDDKYQGALSIVVDTATSDRISDQRYTLADYVIKIDHHIPVDQYGDLIWVDTKFPACSQMITYLAKELKLPITKEAATALYTGILTDTGRFKYRGVSKLTFQLAGLLIEKGVDVEEVDGHLSKESLHLIKYKGFIYQNFITTNKGFVYVKVTPDIIKEYKLTLEEASSVVNLLGGIENYHVWAILIENKEGEIRIRLRSSGPNIDTVANQFNGGGHAKASGATLSSWDELPQFIEAVHKVL